MALVAGRRYYVEVPHKENDGGDFVSVGWRLPNGTSQLPILGTNLIPFTATAVGSATSTSASESAAGVLATESAITAQPELRVYPNPFNSRTTVEFSLSANVGVKLTVFDASGRLMQRLYDGPATAGGRQQFVLPGTSLPPGVYLLQLVTPTQVISQKLLRAD